MPVTTKLEPVPVGEILARREEFEAVIYDPDAAVGVVKRARQMVFLLDELIDRREKERGARGTSR